MNIDIIGTDNQGNNHTIKTKSTEENFQEKITVNMDDVKGDIVSLTITRKPERNMRGL